MMQHNEKEQKRIDIMPIFLGILVLSVIITVIVCVIIAKPSNRIGDDGTYNAGFGVGPGGDLTTPDYGASPEPPNNLPPRTSDMPPPSTDSIPLLIKCLAAKNHIGKYATVYGKVTNIQYASSNYEPTFIFFGVPYPEPGCVIAAVWCEIPDWMNYKKGDSISVTGKLYKDSDGGILIDVNHPSQFLE